MLLLIRGIFDDSATKDIDNDDEDDENSSGSCIRRRGGGGIEAHLHHVRGDASNNNGGSGLVKFYVSILRLVSKRRNEKNLTFSS